MSKRPPLDLMALTSEQAAPMPEATQRMPLELPKTKPQPVPVATRPEAVRT